VSRFSIDVLPDQNYFSHRRCLDILDALGPAVLQELVIVNDWKGVAADDESAACRILARYGGEPRDLKIVEGRPINQTKGEEAGLEDAIRGCSHLESLDIDGDLVTGSTLFGLPPTIRRLRFSDCQSLSYEGFMGWLVSRMQEPRLLETIRLARHGWSDTEIARLQVRPSLSCFRLVHPG
jgi:hypothetical protein